MEVNYPAACNAAETLIVHTSLLDTVWPKVGAALLDNDVKLLCCHCSEESLQQALQNHSKAATHVLPSTDESYETEHLSLTLAVVALPSLEHAIKWINQRSSHHTDAIVTESAAAASAFCRGVDSAGTFVNASTRFADGFRYGFGTEVGISTGRVHARGPVGLEGLVIYKYLLRSVADGGHIAGEFGSGEGAKQFLHEKIDAETVPF